MSHGGFVEKSDLPRSECQERNELGRHVLRDLYMDFERDVDSELRYAVRHADDESVVFERLDRRSKPRARLLLGTLSMQGYPHATENEQGPLIEAKYNRHTFKSDRVGQSVGLWPLGSRGIFYAWTDEMLEWAIELGNDIRDSLPQARIKYETPEELRSVMSMMEARA